MTNPLTPRGIANMVRRSLIQKLHDVQINILVRERFGATAVLHPDIQTKLDLTLWPLEELQERHDELVDQIRTLSDRIDIANEQEILAFVNSIKRGRT